MAHAYGKDFEPGASIINLRSLELVRPDQGYGSDTTMCMLTCLSGVANSIIAEAGFPKKQKTLALISVHMQANMVRETLNPL